jgi:cobalt-zinc-cadmium efflux system outer membrane protein
MDAKGCMHAHCHVEKMGLKCVCICLVAWSAGAQTLEPVTAEQALAEAIERNLDLVAARYEVPIARAETITAALRPNPALVLGGDHLNLLPPRYSLLNNAGPAEYSARLDYTLERGGKRGLRVEVARAAESVAELLVVEAVRQLALQVQTTYVEVLRAKADLAVAQEIAATFAEIARINEERVRRGDLAEVEAIRSQVAVLQFETTVRQAELAVATARTRLQVLLGRGPGAAVADPTDELRRQEGTRALEDLRNEAMRQRPDLEAQRRERVRTVADTRLQAANAKVDHVIGAEYRRQQGLAGTGNSIGLFWESPLPVFNRNQGGIARARQVQLQTEARTRAIEATVRNEVEVAWLTVQNSLRNLERIERTLLPRAREVRDITDYSYRRGEASFLEFLDAQRAYSETRQSLNDSLARLAQSLYELDAATGATTAGMMR